MIFPRERTSQLTVFFTHWAPIQNMTWSQAGQGTIKWSNGPWSKEIYLLNTENPRPICKVTLWKRNPQCHSLLNYVTTLLCSLQISFTCSPWPAITQFPHSPSSYSQVYLALTLSFIHWLGLTGLTRLLSNVFFLRCLWLLLCLCQFWWPQILDHLC